RSAYHLRLFVIRLPLPPTVGPNLGMRSPQNARRVGAYFGLSKKRDRRIPRSFRWCARCVAANRPKPLSLSSSSPEIDVLRGLEPRPAISARAPKTVLLVSEPKPNRRPESEQSWIPAKAVSRQEAFSSS